MNIRPSVYAPLVVLVLLVVPAIAYTQQQSGETSEADDGASTGRDEAPVKRSSMDLSSLTREERRALFHRLEAARAEYDKKNYRTALRDFERAYQLLRHPSILFRIADCYERLGKYREAREAYQDFLVYRPDTEARPRIERAIEELERKILANRARITVRTEPAGARVSFADVPGQVLGTTPLTLRSEPGERTLVLYRKGYKLERRTIDVEDGKTITIDTRLVDRDAVPTMSWVLWATGFVATTATVGLLPVYLNDRSYIEDIDARKQDLEDRPDDYDRRFERKETLEPVLVVGGSLAAVSLIAGLVWWRLSVEPEAEPPGAAETALMPWWDGRAVGVSWKLRF